MSRPYKYVITVQKKNRKKKTGKQGKTRSAFTVIRNMMKSFFLFFLQRPVLVITTVILILFAIIIIKELSIPKVVYYDMQIDSSFGFSDEKQKDFYEKNFWLNLFNKSTLWNKKKHFRNLSEKEIFENYNGLNAGIFIEESENSINYISADMGTCIRELMNNIMDLPERNSYISENENNIIPDLSVKDIGVISLNSVVKYLRCRGYFKSLFRYQYYSITGNISSLHNGKWRVILSLDGDVRDSFEKIYESKEKLEQALRDNTGDSLYDYIEFIFSRIDTARFLKTLFFHSEYDVISRICGELEKINHNIPEVALYRGISNIRKNDDMYRTKSLDDLDIAIKRSGNKYPIAFIYRGLLKRTVRKYREALEDFSRAIKLDPHNPLLLYYRAIIYNMYALYLDYPSDTGGSCRYFEDQIYNYNKAMEDINRVSDVLYTSPAEKIRNEIRINLAYTYYYRARMQEQKKDLNAARKDYLAARELFKTIMSEDSEDKILEIDERLGNKK